MTGLWRHVEVNKDEHVAWLSIDRTEAANAINLELLDSLDGAITYLEEDTSIHIVIVTSRSSTVFSAGGDILQMRDLPGDLAEPFVNRGQSTLERISSSRLVVIASLNGHALGGGLELALACDIRIAAAGVMIGFPEVGLGLIPGWGGTQRLSRLVGPSRASLLILTGEQVRSERALELGLVDEVVPGSLLRQRCLEIAGRIGANSPVAVAAAKTAILGARLGYREGFGTERDAWLNVFRSQDHRRRIAGYLERRLHRPPTSEGAD